jgi:hypothetical protein
MLANQKFSPVSLRENQPNWNSVEISLAFARGSLTQGSSSVFLMLRCLFYTAPLADIIKMPASKLHRNMVETRGRCGGVKRKACVDTNNVVTQRRCSLVWFQRAKRESIRYDTAKLIQEAMQLN